MKKMIYILTGLSLVIGLSACEMRDELKGKKELNENEGLVNLDLLAQDYPNIVSTRGSFPAEEVAVENYTVQILDAVAETVVKECTYSQLMAEGGTVKLTAGKYRVQAYNFDGEKMGASERPFFKGVTDFQILPGKTTTVNTTCRLSCLEVNLSLDKTFSENFQDNYTITISNGGTGNYIYTKNSKSNKIYLNIPENSNSVLMSVKATTIDNINIAQSYTIKKPENAENSSQLENGDSFKITINPGDSPVIDPVTKFNLGVTVDLTWIETGATIEIPTENIVFNPGGGNEPGGGDDNKGEIVVTGLNKTYSFASSGSIPTVEVNFSVPNGIQKMLVKIQSDNEGFSDALAGFGLGGEFDLANPGDLLGVLSGSLADGEGIGLIDANDPIKGKTSYKFDITSFMGMLGLFGASANTFTITISDGVNADVTGVLTINVTE